MAAVQPQPLPSRQCLVGGRTSRAKGHKVTSQRVPLLHGQVPDPAAIRREQTRRAAAALLAVTFVLLLPVAVTSAWIRGTILSTGGYVAAVSPAAANPTVRATVQQILTTQVDHVLKQAENKLPAAPGGLAGPLASGLADLAGNGISDFMTTQTFQRWWADVNRVTHDQLISVLNGNSSLVTTTGGRVVLNLLPLVNEVLHSISPSLPSVRAIPATACQAITRSSATACAQIPLFSASALAGPRHVYRILVAVTWLALILTPLAFACALAVSPRKRRTVLQMATGGTLTLLAALAAALWLRSSLIARAPTRYQAVTSVIVHALTGSLTNGLILTACCAVAGCALTAMALLCRRCPMHSALDKRGMPGDLTVSG
jgi:hypothetical protein